MLKLQAAFPDVQPLSSYADVTCGPFGSAIKNEDYRTTGIPLLRISDIEEDGTIDTSAIKFIDEELSLKHQSSRVQPGDIVLSQRGTIGLPAVVPDLFPVWHISANLIAIKNSDAPIAYVRDYLGSTFAQAHFARRNSGQIQSKITTSDVSALPFPRVADEAALCAKLDATRAATDAALAAADAELSGLYNFILEELGLALPPPAAVVPFAIRLTDVANSRVDAEYHSPRFRHLRSMIETGPFESQSIKELCLPLLTGFAAGGGDQSDEAEGTPHLRPTNITAGGEISLARSKYVPTSAPSDIDIIKEGEVLFNNTNSSLWVGKSAVFDIADKCACSNHITRLRLRDPQNSPVYLAALLNAFRASGYFAALATNFNNQAGINSDALSALRVPLPPAPIQAAIADEVERRRAEARRLRAEARAGWATARQAFEDALLGKPA